VQRWQFVGGVKTLDRIHQIERRTVHQTLVGVTGDQTRMRNSVVPLGIQIPYFACQHVVGGWSQVTWPTAQHKPAFAALETEHHILGSSTDRVKAAQRAAFQMVVVHPRAQDVDVDEALEIDLAGSVVST